MSEDLYEMIKRRQDELRGREEDWIDHLFGWWYRVDKGYLVFRIIMVPHIAMLLAIELCAIWWLFR